MNLFFKDLLSKVKKYKSWGDSDNVVGIDIGSSSVKVVELKKRGAKTALVTYGEMSTGAYSKKEIGQSVSLSEEQAVKVVKDILSESNVKSKRVIVSIPLKSSFITTITVPAVDSDKMEDVVNFEARKYVPVPISEVVLDWVVIPKEKSDEEDLGIESNEEKSSPTDVLLVAIHKDVIESYKKIIAASGLELVTFEIEIFSAVRSAAGKETKPLVVIDFGASTTKIVIVDNGFIKLVHTISKGSQELTIALAHSLGVDFTRAEEMKRKIGLSGNPEYQNMVGVLTPILSHIFSESNRTIIEYQRKHKKIINKAILTGGGSNLKGLVDFAVNSFGIETSIANPFLKTEYPLFLKTPLQEAGPSFGVSLGLALRGWNSY